MSALAVAAWLIFSAVVAGHVCDDVSARTQTSYIAFQPLSACQERGYCSCERQRPGGVELQLSRGTTSIRSQPMSVAFAA
jgi:hypothetical protein